MNVTTQARTDVSAARAAALLARALSCVLIAFGLGSLSEPARALDPNQTFVQLHHTSWTAREGAPGSIWALAQTTDGMLWIGTETGLMSFDGVKFQRFSPVGDDPPLTEDISALYALPSGDLWVGTRFGTAYLLHGGRVTTFGPKQGLPRHTLFSFIRDSAGVLWTISTTGVYQFADGRWSHFVVDPVNHDEWFMTMGIDAKGALWIAGNSGAYFLPKGGKTFMSGPRPRKNSVLSIDDQGRPWMSYEDCIEAPNGRLPPNAIPGVKVDDYTLRFFDREGMGYFMSGRELVRASAEKTLTRGKAVATSKASASADRVSIDGAPQAFFEDREGNLWVGSNEGLHRFRSNKLNLVIDPKLAFHNAALVPAADGGIWFGNVTSGLLKIKDYATSANVLGGIKDSNAIDSLHIDPKGVLWIGGRGQLLRSTATGFEKVAIPYSGVGFPTQAIETDADGVLWIAAVRKGIWRFKEHQWVPPDNGIPTEIPLVMRAGKTGGMWFGYPDDIVKFWFEGKVQTYGKSNGLDIGNVLAIHVAPDAIWLGGSNGIAVFAQGHFTTIRGQNGDTFRGVSGIAETAQGEIWLNGSAGVTRLPLTEVQSVYRDPSRQVVAETMTSLDGIEGVAQQIRPLQTIVSSPVDGRLWFSTTKSVYWVDPQRIRRNTLPPSVFIQTVAVDGATINASGHLKMPQGTSGLHIAYTATSLTIPERVLFRYRLEGVDKDWQDAKTRRDAWYTNLRPGRYHFEVVASNEDGVWSAESAALDFSIPTPWYETIWFYVACGLLLATIVWAVAALRVRQISERNRLRFEDRMRLREQIARELHDTLLQDTQGLVLSFQVLAERMPLDDPSRSEIERVLDQGDAVIAKARDSVTGLRSSEVVQHDLLEVLSAATQDMPEGEGAEVTVNSIGDDRQLRPEIQNEVVRVAKEALLNALRHAQADQIEVRIVYGPRTFEVRVIDDGMGIDEATLSAGSRPGHWGLIGMKERAARIGATFSVTCPSGGGTTVVLSMTAERAYLHARPPTIREFLRSKFIRRSTVVHQ